MTDHTQIKGSSPSLDQAAIESLLRRLYPNVSRAVITAASAAMLGAFFGVVKASAEIQRGVEVTDEPIAEGEAAMEVAGQGLGKILPSSEEGMALLKEVSREVPLEDWAGEIMTPSDLLSHLGIARSTLTKWRKDGDVIALPKGKTAHVFPIGQFQDGRPIKEISGILSLTSGNSVVAWRWLTSPSLDLGMNAPIEALLNGQNDDVMESAQNNFG